MYIIDRFEAGEKETFAVLEFYNFPDFPDFPDFSDFSQYSQLSEESEFPDKFSESSKSRCSPPNTSAKPQVLGGEQQEYSALLSGKDNSLARSKVVPRTALPPEAKPGDVLNRDFSVNREETAIRKRYVKSLTERIFNEK